MTLLGVLLYPLLDLQKCKRGVQTDRQTGRRGELAGKINKVEPVGFPKI